MATTTIDLFGGTLMSPIENPYPVYRRLRQEHPVQRLRGWFGEENLITRYADVDRILHDPTTFSSRANARGIGMVMGRTILEMEGKDHVRHRNLISPFFSLRALKSAHQNTMQRIAHQLIDQFEASGATDLVRQFTFTYPLRVLAEIIGIPIADFDEFHHRALDLISIADNPAKGFEAAQWLGGYLQPILADRRQHPSGDLLSALSHGEVHGDRLTDDEVIAFLRLLLPAGAETTYRLIGTTLFVLLSHTDILSRVRSDPAAIDALIDETLRWESPVQYVSRETTVEVVLGGQSLPPGEMLFVALGSANRDESVFSDPDRFDLDRDTDNHLAFGFGPHFCAGSHLARIETTVAIAAILERLPKLRFDNSQPGSKIVGLAFRSPDHLHVRFDR